MQKLFWKLFKETFYYICTIVFLAGHLGYFWLIHLYVSQCKSSSSTLGTIIDLHLHGQDHCPRLAWNCGASLLAIDSSLYAWTQLPHVSRWNATNQNEEEHKDQMNDPLVMAKSLPLVDLDQLQQLVASCPQKTCSVRGFVPNTFVALQPPADPHICLPI